MGPILEKKVLQAEKQKTTVEAGQKGRSPLQATLALQSFLGGYIVFCKILFFSKFLVHNEALWTTEKNF